MFQKIATALRTNGNPECKEQAKLLDNCDAQIRYLNLRNLNLKPNDILVIAHALKQERLSSSLTSISFSYNIKIGDIGAIALASSLPLSLKEIGFVDCGISDKGGIAILEWAKTLSNLQMLCIEENNFSDKLKSDFKDFEYRHSGVVVVV